MCSHTVSDRVLCLYWRTSENVLFVFFIFLLSLYVRFWFLLKRKKSIKQQVRWVRSNGKKKVKKSREYGIIAAKILRYTLANFYSVKKRRREIPFFP